MLFMRPETAMPSETTPNLIVGEKTQGHMENVALGGILSKIWLTEWQGDKQQIDTNIERSIALPETKIVPEQHISADTLPLSMPIQFFSGTLSGGVDIIPTAATEVPSSSPRISPPLTEIHITRMAHTPSPNLYTLEIARPWQEPAVLTTLPDVVAKEFEGPRSHLSSSLSPPPAGTPIFGEYTIQPMAKGTTPGIMPAYTEYPSPARAGIAQTVQNVITRSPVPSQIEVTLDPPELGRVRIEFDFSNTQQVKAVVSSAEQDTIHWLRRQGQALEQDLLALGFDAVELSYAEKDAWDHSFGGRPSPPSQEVILNVAHATISLNPTPIHMSSDGRLDIRL